MKKHSILFLLLIICGCFLIPSKSFAFQHGYESHSDFIYALARNELPVYISDYSGDLKTMLPKYSGVKVEVLPVPGMRFSTLLKKGLVIMAGSQGKSFNQTA